MTRWCLQIPKPTKIQEKWADGDQVQLQWVWEGVVWVEVELLLEEMEVASLFSFSGRAWYLAAPWSIRLLEHRKPDANETELEKALSNKNQSRAKACQWLIYNSQL